MQFLAVFGIAVAEGDTVAERNHAARTGCGLCKQIPAVIGIVVGYAAVKDITLTAGELCCKAVCVFHCGIIAVVAGGAVLEKVVRRAVAAGLADLQAGILIVLKAAHLDNIVAAAENHTIVACFLHFDAIPVSVIATHIDSAIRGTG